MNIVEPILYQCKLNPFATAIVTPGSAFKSLRYGQLEKIIHSVARAAIQEGLTPGDVVAVGIGDPIMHAGIVFGLMRMGIVTMSLSERQFPDHISTDAVITDAPQFFSGAERVIGINASWFQGDGSPLDFDRIYRQQRDDSCRIILTSGSTGLQKGVALSHEMLADRLAHYAYVKGPLFSKISRLFSGFGVSTLPGYLYMHYMLMRGGTIYFSGREPIDILQYLGAYRVQGLALSPHDLALYVQLFEADPALEAPFEVIVCQGARLSNVLSDRARARFCSSLYTSYGSTETLTVACGPAHNINRTPGAVGFICPGVTVEIVDGFNRLHPAGREGLIRIRTPHLARGYVGDPDSTNQMFRDGAFYSGDLGYVTPEGIMVVTGRQKTALSNSGDTVAPEIIEEVLCEFPGVLHAAAFTIDDEIGISRIYSLIVSSNDFDDEALRSHCETRLRSNFVPKGFIRVEEIPRGGQGKIDRRRVGELAKSLLTSSNQPT
jgi:acyl-CoA synthetase (AMP-forming)/AMP-acid ligase II